MADKFGITAELLLVLDSNIESTIQDLKNRISRTPTNLKVGLEQVDIKSIYKEVKNLQKSFSSKPLYIGLKHREEDIKLIYREIGLLKKSLFNNPLKIRFDSSGVEAVVKNILANINSVKNSLKSKPIDANVGINSTVLEAEIKKVYKEIGALRTSLNNPLRFSVQAVDTQEIVKVSNLINGLRSKNLSIGLNLKKNTLDNFQKLSTAVGSLNSQVSAFNINQFDAIAQKTQAIARSITALNKISGKKITFDLALKDIKNVDKLENGLNRVNAAFIKATNSGSRFTNIIASMANVISSLQSGLSGLNFSSINNAAKSIKTLSGKASVTAQNALTSSIQNSTSALYDLGVQSGITLKRFGAYTLVTAGFFRLSFAIRNAVTEFIDFDKELTRIRQVTGQSLENTSALGDEVGRLATQYGLSSSSILNTAQVLAQAGFSTNQVREAMEALSLTELAPTFENIENTTEGAIAAMSQFGFGVDQLQSKFGSINAVAAAFAVESSDITTAIQKAGGAFASAGGNLDELTALFTTVRSSTRESADTVAVGIRTITTRLQRLSTDKFLQGFGINIRRTADEVKNFQEQFGKTPEFKVGDFVGVFEAIKRISEVTSNISGADPRLAQIGEELAGFRQINKIIPLLRNFEVAQNAMQVSIGGTNSLARDAVIAQESYANQLEKVRQEFQLMIREFGENESIKELIRYVLDLTKFTIKLAASFKDLLVPLAALGVFKIGKNTAPFVQGIKDSFVKRANGGYIPGVGNEDSELIAAMPGEFVIKKKSARKLGPTRLNLLNEGVIPKFASGGFVGRNKAGLAGGAIGAAAIGLQLGGFEALRNLDDTTKETGIALASLAAQILVGVGVFKSFSTELGGFRARIRQLNLKPTDPKLVQSLEKRNELRKVASGGEDFLKTSRNNQNIGITGNRIIGNQRADRANNSSLVRLTSEKNQLEKRLNSFGVDANSQTNLSKNIKSLDQKIAKKQQEYINALNKSITEEKVDPRSSAGKRGLTSQFRIKDSQTGTFRNFDTRKEAIAFGIQRNNINKRREIGSLVTTRDSRVNRLRDLQNTQQRLSTVNSAIQARTVAPNLTQARLLGTFEGRKEKVNQANITARIQERLAKQEIDKAGARRGTLGIKSIFGTATSGFGKFSNSTAGAGAGLGLALGGQFAGNFIQQRNSADKGVGARTNNAIGGAISSATSGAAIGATIGTLIAPGIGTAVGLAVGGIGGAVVGAVGSLKEFDNQLSAINAQGSINSINKIFEEIKAGSTTSKTSTFGVTSNIKNLRNQLQSNSDPSTRENIFAELNNQKVNITNFISDIAKISSSYDTFSQRVDNGTQRFIAGIVGIPFSEFEKNIKEQIETANKLDDSYKRGIQSIQNFDNTISATIRFSEAFSLASQRVNSFTNNLEAFASGSSGSTSIKNNLSSNLTNLQSGISTKGLENQVIDFTKQFGASGQALGKTAADIIKATNILPDILLDLRSASALDESGAVTQKFSKSLEDAGIGKTVSNLLISRVEDLLGASSQDTEFFKNINKDPQKAIQTLLEGTKPALDAISQAYETSTVRLNEFASSLEKVRNFDKAILDGVVKTQDRSQFIQARGTFTGKNVNSELLNNQRNITRLNTGGLSVGQLAIDSTQRRSNIQGLTKQLEGTEDIQARARIQVALEKERSALDKTTTALSYLANTTAELSILQQQLNKAQSERLTKRDFALDFASSDPEERNKLSRTARAARSAAVTGSLSGTPTDLKKDVISFLKTFSDSVIASGKTGNEVLNNIANNATGLPVGFQNTGTPTKEESAIQSQIEASLKTQQEAQKAINSVLISDRQAFFTQLNKDMQTFFVDLKNILAEGQTRDLKNQIGSTASKLQDTTQKRNSLLNIQGKFGENALVNAPNIKAFNEERRQSLNTSLSSQKSIEKLNRFKTIENSSVPGNISKEVFGNDFFQKRTVLGGNFVDETNAKKILDFITSNLSQNNRDSITQKFNTDVQRKDGLISVSEINKFLEVALKDIQKRSTSKFFDGIKTEKDLVSNVGGVKNFEAISRDVASKDSVLLKSINDFPKDASISGLNSEIKNLKGQLSALNRTLQNSPRAIQPIQPIRRNSGGIIPGVGNTDSVPALLTPGEFVIKKDTVNKLGLNNLIKLNAQKFANGGLVKNRRLEDLKRNFPKTISSNLDNYGVSILSSDKITNIDPELRFQKPRGSNSSFDDIKGLYRNQSKQILIREDSGIDVLFHELGHAFDYSEGTVSDSKKYMVAYKRDVSKLNEDQKKKFAYYLQNGIGGQRESFAAIFDSVIRNNSTSSSIFPEATKIVQESVKASEIRNLHDSYKEIRKLRNVETPDFNLLLDKVKESKLKISSSALVKDDPRVQKFLSQLNIAEELYSQKAIRRNSGGIVPGFGSSDSVPALLTPGEFVLNKSAVKNIGLQTLRKTNSGAKKFASGGMVENNTIIDKESVSRFNIAVNQLGVQIQNMRDAISKIPTEITMNGTHRVDVFINGAQAFNQMKPEFADLVRTEIKNSINKLIKTKMPTLGNFEG